ncbi:MAG: hypothetical protein JNJ83_23325 [Verrucomicrobiaceae bacterium]|nr:hypothetical protein [Verrucomicrobiaceae bacterium]
MKPSVSKSGRTYVLRSFKAPLARAKQKRRVVPPRPKTGERRPRAYSTDELDSLLATAHSVNWKCMVSLKTPPHGRIETHEHLVRSLTSLKRKLENLRKRNHFPASIVVTEFDPDTHGIAPKDTAHFHIGFAAKLTSSQEATLRHWWLSEMNLENNQGRAFQLDAKGGGKKLQGYLSKDISRRHGMERFVKYPVAWLPKRIDCRLWFVVGTKRLGSKHGRAMRATNGMIRKRYEGEHPSTHTQRVRVSKESREGEQGLLPLTSDPKAVRNTSCNPVSAWSIDSRFVGSPWSQDSPSVTSNST